VTSLEREGVKAGIKVTPENDSDAATNKIKAK